MTDATFNIPSAVRRDIWQAGIVVGVFAMSVLLWAMLAPIATTVRMSGEISSTAPSHTVQHPKGGRVQEVHVSLHDRISAGDLILTFDTTELKLRQQALEQRGGYLKAELLEIALRFDPRLVEDARSSASNPMIARVFRERDQILKNRLSSGDAKIEAAQARKALLQEELEATVELRRQIAERLEKSTKLVSKGYLAETEVERVREAWLEMNAEIAGKTSQLEALSAEIAATWIHNELIKAEYSQDLAEQRAANERELVGIEAELSRIEYDQKLAEVRATTSGMITNLDFGTVEMVAPAGATLAVISQPLADPTVQLRVPTRHVDQVVPGQTGKLTISSLPARSAPELELTILSVGEEPEKDPEGNAQYYLAEGQISGEDLHRAHQRLGDRFQLVRGMPVSAALAGDTITFWEFLSSPLVSIWSKAFEE